MTRKLLALTLLLALPAVVLPLGARADGPSRHLRYEVYWGGLHAADFALSLDRSGDAYSHEFRMRSSGIAEWLFKLDITARSQGRVLASGPPMPVSYRTDFVNRWRNGLVDIRYTAGQGDIPGAMTVTEWADPPRRTDQDDPAEPVDEEDRAGALDPLAAFTEAVRLASQHLAPGSGEFRLKVFDGRRRFDLVGTPLGTGTLNVLGQQRQVQRLHLRTEPIAGFNGRQQTIWNERVFEVFFLPSPTPGGEPIPVRIAADGTGPVINLTAECPDRAACAVAPRAAGESRPPAGDARSG